MADPKLPAEGVARLNEILDVIRAQAREMSTFDGTQNTRAIAKLEKLINDLPGQIYAVLATAVNTGTITTTGVANIGGVLTANAGLSSTDAKTRVLTSGWSSLWVDTSGRFGQSPSARRFKQDIVSVEIDADGLLALTPVHYRLKAAVEEFGDDAPVEVGLIAEDLEPVAPWAVYYNAEGQIQGINYDRLTVALLELAKRQQAQIDGFEARLAALEARE